MTSYYHVPFVTRTYDDTMILLCVRACDMSCALPMPIICSHDMIAMISSSMLHLRTTSLHDLFTIIACFVASPIFHSYSLSWVDDIYVHASHMIYLVHYHLPPIIASMLIDLGDFDTLRVMHACWFEPIVFGCSCLLFFHSIPHIVISYDKNDENTCWVSHHSNDRFCIYANLICFSECLSCAFILKDSQGGTIMKHLGHVKAYMMHNTNISTSS